MKKLFLMLALLVSFFFAFASIAKACGKDGDKGYNKCWALRGSYTIVYTLGGGGDYSHTYTITSFDKKTGEFAGTGVYDADSSYTETITGQVIGSDISFQVVYTGSNAGYVVDAVGTIDKDGNISGTATGPGQTFTWKATKGVAFRCFEIRDYHWRFGPHRGWNWNDFHFFGPVPGFGPGR
jgi:hypothetical protein